MKGVSGDDIVEFPSMLAAHKTGRFQLACIQKCIKGTQKSHMGYLWHPVAAIKQGVAKCE